MIQDLDIGYFNGIEYEREKYLGPLEIVSFHGSLAENDPFFHIHVAAANSTHGVSGGHFFSGKANPLLEVHMRVLRGISMKRVLNEDSTLMELTIG